MHTNVNHITCYFLLLLSIQLYYACVMVVPNITQNDSDRPLYITWSPHSPGHMTVCMQFMFMFPECCWMLVSPHHFHVFLSCISSSCFMCCFIIIGFVFMCFTLINRNLHLHPSPLLIPNNLLYLLLKLLLILMIKPLIIFQVVKNVDTLLPDSAWHNLALNYNDSLIKHLALINNNCEINKYQLSLFSVLFFLLHTDTL